jgi:hypothetical protein
MVEKLLNIGQFFNQVLFESKLQIMKEFGCALGIFGKPLWWIGFNEGDSKHLKPKVQEILN